MGNVRYRFGEFTFDPESGELHGAGDVQRLAPQPTKLLTLLVERNGKLLTREEIREAIWPGVQVDFDASLHFCVSQIRSALGDSATGSRYVETLPRRGYRLVPPSETLADGPEPARARPQRIALGALVVVGVLAGLGWWRSGRTTEGIRIGVMPFEPPSATAAEFPAVGDIAEWVVDRLDERTGRRAAVIGPTTTSEYAESDASIRRLTEDYDLEWVVNGRFLVRDEGPRMFAELIRARDGAHVWVQMYADVSNGRAVGREIADSVTIALGLERR